MAAAAAGGATSGGAQAHGVGAPDILGMLDPRLRAALAPRADAGAADAAVRAVCAEVCAGVFAFPMLSAEGCEQLIDELDAFQVRKTPKWPRCWANFSLF